jgi:hypothetical protein
MVMLDSLDQDHFSGQVGVGDGGSVWFEMNSSVGPTRDGHLTRLEEELDQRRPSRIRASRNGGGFKHG